MKSNLIIVILLAGIAGAQAQKQQPRTPNFNPSVRSAFKAPAGGQGNPRLSFGGNTNSRGSSAGLSNQGRVFPGGNRVTIPGGARQGLDVAARLREMENLRQRMPERLYDPGKFNTGGGGQPRPQDPREAGGYNPRSPGLPAGVSRNQRSGFTDVRGARDRGTRGSSTNRGDFNPSTLRIFDDGVRMRFGAGSGFHSPHSEGHSADHQRGTTTIYEDFDGPMGPGRYSVTEHRGADGQVTGITERFAMRVSGGKTNVTEIHRRSDGSIISTERETVEERYPKDGKGGSADTAAASDPGKKTGGDRSPAEISNGGPGGPSLKVVSGITTLDLLRQHADGSGARGGGFYDIRANGVDQVRPVGEEQQIGVAGYGTPPGLEEVDTLGNPGSAGGGGDLPD